MNHRVNEQVRAFGTLVVLFGLGIILSILTVILGPIIETKYFPVIEDSQFSIVDAVKPEGVSVLVLGEKKRACRFLEVNALVKDPASNLYQKAEVSFSTQNGNATRPTGMQSFGVWTFVPSGKSVVLEVRHECHGMWETVTKLGEVDLS